MTADLVQFLRARLDEDELIARDASVEAWTKDEAPSIFVMSVNGLVAETSAFTDALHIARHDPARVLAEVDAKRALLDDLDYGGSEMADARWHVARRLASVYTDHPDYCEEWKP